MTVYVPLPSDDPRQRQPDIRLAKERLNWSPSVLLETGLRKTMWRRGLYRENRGCIRQETEGNFKRETQEG